MFGGLIILVMVLWFAWGHKNNFGIVIEMNHIEDNDAQAHVEDEEKRVSHTDP